MKAGIPGDFVSGPVRQLYSFNEFFAYLDQRWLLRINLLRNVWILGSKNRTSRLEELLIEKELSEKFSEFGGDFFDFPANPSDLSQR